MMPLLHRPTMPGAPDRGAERLGVGVIFARTAIAAAPAEGDRLAVIGAGTGDVDTRRADRGEYRRNAIENRVIRRRRQRIERIGDRHVGVVGAVLIVRE